MNNSVNNKGYISSSRYAQSSGTGVSQDDYSKVSTDDINGDISAQKTYSSEDVKDIITSFFPDLQPSHAESLVDVLFTKPFARQDDTHKKAEAIKGGELERVFKFIAEKGSGNNEDISFDDIASNILWNQIPRNINQDGHLEVSYQRKNTPTKSPPIEKELEDSGEYKRNRIGDSENDVIFPSEYEDVIDSVIQNSPHLQKNIERILGGLNEENELHVIDNDLSGNQVGATNGYIHRNYTGDTLVISQAIVNIDFSYVEENVDRIYNGARADGQKEWDALSEEEQQEVTEQYIAQILIHEIGHLDGDLGSHEECCGPGLNGHHGPEHSQYIGGLYNEWISERKENGEDVTQFWDFEKQDYSVNSYYDREEVLDKEIDGSDQKLGDVFYELQESLLDEDYDNFNDALKEIPDTMYITQKYSDSQSGADAFRSIPAKEYVIGLLLYESFDATGIGGSDRSDDREEVLYSDNQAQSNFNEDGNLTSGLKGYFQSEAYNNLKETSPKDAALLREQTRNYALEDDFLEDVEENSNEENVNNNENVNGEVPASGDSTVDENKPMFFSGSTNTSPPTQNGSDNFAPAGPVFFSFGGNSTPAPTSITKEQTNTLSILAALLNSWKT